MHRKMNYLVVDSGAFIKGSPLHEMAENLYTLPDVIEEIKDKATKARLQTMPYELNYKQPSQEDIHFIAEFAKKTGDFGYLSLVDIKLMALTLALEKQFNGTEHLHKEPNQQKVITKCTNKVVRTAGNIDGFFTPKNNEDHSHSKGDEVPTEEDTKAVEADGDKFKEESREEQTPDNENENENDTESVENEESEEVDEEDEDEEGWITPNNIEQIKSKVGLLSLNDDKENETKTIVACITGDFAIQNVLIQIGLKVVSIDSGLIIRETKQFVLRCHACFKITTNLMKKFCPHCGNLGTLKRVTVKVNENGERVIFINFRKPINVRGKRYSLPMPKSGKHVNNPIVVEDQPIPQNKASKFAVIEKRIKSNTILGDPDYVVRNTPFSVNDVYSKSSRLRKGKEYYDLNSKRNPNEVRKSTGNRKKKNDRF